MTPSSNLQTVLKDALRERNVAGARAAAIPQDAEAHITFRNGQYVTHSGAIISDWLDDKLASTIGGIPREMFETMSPQTKYLYASREAKSRSA